MRELKYTYPLLNVGVRTGNTGDMVRAVEENRLDIALITLPAAGRNVLITPLLQDEFVAIFLQPILTCQRNFRRGITRLSLVVFESGSSTRLLIDSWFQQAGITSSPIMELGSIEAIKEMVAAGLGFSIVPRMSLAAHTPFPGSYTARYSLLLNALWVLRCGKISHNKGLQKVINRLNDLQY
ncbi:LysR family transcriptional regulator substrate-binding protein [Serratia ureilytica]